MIKHLAQNIPASTNSPRRWPPSLVIEYAEPCWIGDPSKARGDRDDCSAGIFRVRLTLDEVVSHGEQPLQIDFLEQGQTSRIPRLQSVLVELTNPFHHASTS